ncbi:hypothetical protein AcW2_005318 [Taiwanofungus camphoratus]|nr:hypothetical protein AcW2_005318 [Antrodia cinnamomea]
MIAFAAEPFPGTFWPVGKSSLKCGICTSLNFPPLSSFGAPTEHQRCDYCPQHLGGMNQVNSRNEMQPESAFECDDGYNRAVEEARTAVASHRGSQDALLDGYLDLAINLFSRFERFGRTEDAEESLFWERQALQLASDSHPDRPMFLNNLCVSLLTLHEAQKSKRLDSHKDSLRGHRYRIFSYCGCGLASSQFTFVPSYSQHCVHNEI